MKTADKLDWHDSYTSPIDEPSVTLHFSRVLATPEQVNEIKSHPFYNGYLSFRHGKLTGFEAIWFQVPVSKLSSNLNDYLPPVLVEHTLNRVAV